LASNSHEQFLPLPHPIRAGVLVIRREERYLAALIAVILTFGSISGAHLIAP
jgi:hypothetical protein